MARTLPWLIDGAPVSVKAPRDKQAKRQKLALSSNSDDGNLPAPTMLASRWDAVSTAQRTPSTSPPPEPPTEEYMQDGLDRDDIYIMVEDEFCAIAKTFTQHLHHAEYTRLKALAKKSQPTSPLSSSNLSRPIDSITTMRAETKKKKESEARDAKNKLAIHQLKAPTKRPASDDDSDVSESEEEDKKDATWSGTALQTFMNTNSPRKNQLPSLTGLEGVRSSTRAAAGFSKPENRVSLKAGRTFDLSPKAIVPRKPKDNSPATPEVFTSDPSDDDDLDAPLPRRLALPLPNPSAPETTTATTKTKPANRPSQVTAKNTRPLPTTTKNPSTNTTSSTTRHTMPPPDPVRNRLPYPQSSTKEDNLENPLRPASSTFLGQAARLRMKERRERERKGRKGGGTEASEVANEIPIFLVG